MVVAMIDTQDKWHLPAIALLDALAVAAVEPIIFDIVISETISVLTRRAHEQKRVSQLGSLLDRMEHYAPLDKLTWISSTTQRVYPNILSLVRAHNGELNFHDALIALICRERDIPYIASFDRDFDQVEWLTRLDTPAKVPRS
jgi:predicted nucleic acid-binding protein